MASLGCLLALAGPASAHVVAGTGASDYRTRLTSVEPRVPGLRVRVVETGSRLELTNRSAADVVVTGYSEEPYLRVGPAGVFTNTRSPATYANASRTGATVPPDADPAAPPVWRLVSRDHTARWYDRRIHWTNKARPPVVRAAPHAYHLIGPWVVPLTYAGRPGAIRGVLEWVPGPSPWPWAGLAVAAFVAVVLLGTVRPVPAVAVATAAVVAVDVLHTVGIAAVNAGPWTVAARYVLSASGVSVLTWGAGLAAVWLVLRGRSGDGAYLAAFCGGAVAVTGGLFDLATLGTSTPPFALPAVVARLAVALSLGLGAGLFTTVALRSLRRPSSATGG